MVNNYAFRACERLQPYTSFQKFTYHSCCSRPATYVPLKKHTLLRHGKRFSTSANSRLRSGTEHEEEAPTEVVDGGDALRTDLSSLKEHDVWSSRYTVLTNNPDIFKGNALRMSLYERNVATRDEIPIVVLLLTPSLTSLLTGSQEFVSNILKSIFVRSKLAAGSEFDVLAAVVDRIPFPSQGSVGGLNFESVDAINGAEGFSMYVTNWRCAAQDLWSNSTQTVENPKNDVEDIHSISFELCSSDYGKLIGSLDGQDRQTSYTCELPLADTIFHNGHRSTLVAQRWTFSRSSLDSFNSKPNFHCVREKSLRRQTIKMPRNAGNRWNKNMELKPFQRITFYPITRPRIISASMGNIIRLFKVNEFSDETQTASEELERLIETVNRVYPDRIARSEIWAQVTPQEYWSDLPTLSDSHFEHIGRGSRYHRVLSGGGGWGIKKGLISLDPHVCFGSSTRPEEELVDSVDDVETDQRSMLGEIVRPGDVVQFYINQNFPSLRDPFKLINTDEATNGASQAALIFGSTFPLVDEPLVESNSKDVSTKPYYIIRRAHFGALSQKGIGISVRQLKGLDDIGRGVHGSSNVLRTKLPRLSRFVCVPTDVAKRTPFPFDQKELGIASSVFSANQKSEQLLVRQVLTDRSNARQVLPEGASVATGKGADVADKATNLLEGLGSWTE